MEGRIYRKYLHVIGVERRKSVAVGRNRSVETVCRGEFNVSTLTDQSGKMRPRERQYRLSKRTQLRDSLTNQEAYGIQCTSL